MKEIHSDLILLDAEEMVNTAGRRLKVMEGKKLFLETEHEMNVFMDYCIFQYNRSGRNIAERYYDLRSSLYTGEKLAALTALKDARFSFLTVVRAADEHGVVVNDPLTGKELLMIDRGLHQLVKKDKNYAVLTHYLSLSEFVMTTGAATPVPLTSEAGKEMLAIFNKLVINNQKVQLLDEKSYKQCITELYKTVIHSDAAKIITSRGLPMNHHQLNKENLFIN